MLATSSLDIHIVQNVGKPKELRVPATIFSSIHPDKSLQTTAVVDCGAAATFIHWMFVQKHGIKTHRFTTPFPIWTADGKISENPITHYCHLAIKIDGRLMFGKFNIMNMSDWDMILLGKPWLTAMNPDIDWAKDTLRLSLTPRSLRLEKAFEKLWRENSTPSSTPLLKPRKTVSIEEEEDQEQFAPLHSPLPNDGKRTLERWKEKKKKEPIPILIPDPDDEPPQYDTVEDVWDDSSMFARKVEDPVTYPINNDEVLIKYAQDGSSVTLHKNLSFDSPLTCDGTSASEIRWTAALRPLRNSWIYAWKTKENEYLKTSNKAQEFALKDAQEKKKKTFEELVPDYLHDFADVFAKDGLNKLPPSRPGVDHRIETKPGFILKSAKTYPLSPKETDAVKAFLDEHIAKDFIQPSKSLQASGFFFIGKKRQLSPTLPRLLLHQWMDDKERLSPSLNSSPDH
jgi:hypothetical protein